MWVGIIIIVIIILSIVFAFIGLGLRVKYLTDKNNELEIEVDGLKETLKNQKRNLQILKDHQSAVQEITKNNNTLKDKVRSAKNDKEIFAVVADIVRANNKRVQDD